MDDTYSVIVRYCWSYCVHEPSPIVVDQWCVCSVLQLLLLLLISTLVCLHASLQWWWTSISSLSSHQHATQYVATPRDGSFVEHYIASYAVIIHWFIDWLSDWLCFSVPFDSRWHYWSYCFVFLCRMIDWNRKINFQTSDNRPTLYGGRDSVAHLLGGGRYFRFNCYEVSRDSIPHG